MKASDLDGFRGYVLYGKDAKDLVERIVSFSNSCSKLVFDDRLYEIAREVCSDNVEVAKLGSVSDVERHLLRGKHVVLQLKPPLNGVVSIALVVAKVRR